MYYQRTAEQILKPIMITQNFDMHIYDSEKGN